VIRARRESESAKAKNEAERKLRDSLREKELLLQEVHHRVNNNLQIVSSLINLQKEVIRDPILFSALHECQQRVQSMAMIHAMLYASSSLKDIDFGEYARQLATQVSNSYGIDTARIRLVFELAPIRLEIDRAIPCGLILNELLSNAFKYAFPRDTCGQIRVSLRTWKHSIRLAVEDTGIGLPDGPAGERKSLGLNIVNTLCKQLGGTMDITSDHGARFVLTIDSFS